MRRWLWGGCAAVLCAVAGAWPGWDWETWRSESGASAPDIASPQSGVATLYPLLAPDDDPAARITTVEGWERKAARIRSVVSALMGTPSKIEQTEPSASEIGRATLEHYERRHIMIAGEAGDPIPAYLLVPPLDGDGPRPVMIVLHQTHAEGKKSPAGMAGDDDREIAHELALRGMMCLVPDAVGFGERIPEGRQPYDNAQEFLRKHPKWSFFGKMNWDVSRCVDYLETLPEVDTGRIGVIGHSHGAYGAFMAGAFDERIDLVVASCGFTTLRRDPVPNRWSHLTALLPNLGFYADHPADTPFDWHEVLALIAPRPFYYFGTLEDSIFPNTDDFPQIYEQLTGVYALYGAEARFTGRIDPGPHGMPDEVRDDFYEWIEAEFERD